MFYLSKLDIFYACTFYFYYISEEGKYFIFKQWWKVTELIQVQYCGTLRISIYATSTLLYIGLSYKTTWFGFEKTGGLG